MAKKWLPCFPQLPQVSQWIWLVDTDQEKEVGETHVALRPDTHVALRPERVSSCSNEHPTAWSTASEAVPVRSCGGIRGKRDAIPRCPYSITSPD
eukprot:2125439-Rhodomonas_salina.1